MYLGYGLAAILRFIGVKLMLHALHQNNAFINDGEDVPVVELSTGFSLLVIIGILIVTIAFSCSARRARHYVRYRTQRSLLTVTQLPEDASAEQRQKPQKMDY